jgi:hypothetical protein
MAMRSPLGRESKPRNIVKAERIQIATGAIVTTSSM